MRVQDIYAEAAEYLGTNDQTHVFRTLTRAVEYLACKGDWDVLKGYVDLPVQSSNLVVLPSQVETPLKFNLNDKPAFSKDRLYEFTLNGFGSNPGKDRSENAWEDRGFVPTFVIPPVSPLFYVLISPAVNPADVGKKVLIRGQNALGAEIRDTLIINSTMAAISTQRYAKLTEINKDATLAGISIYSSLSGPEPTTTRWTVNIASDPYLSNSDDTITIAYQDAQGIAYSSSYVTTGGQTLDDVLTDMTVGHQTPDGGYQTGMRFAFGITASKDDSGNLVLSLVGADFTVTSAMATWPTTPPLPGQVEIPTHVTNLPRNRLSNVLPYDSVLLATYRASETEPKYRLLKLSQTGVTCRFLFRRKTFQIVSMDDFIPVQSQLGLLTMVQSIQALRRKDLEVAKALADAAVEMTTDAQRATTGFIELANNTESQAARNYQIYNRDSVIMLDIFDDVAKILGNVGENEIFDMTTMALEVLCTKGHYDGLTGYVDIQTDGWRYATLPRFVDQPVAISVNGRPAYMRNKWSEFHLNGPGTDEYGGQYMGGAQFGSWYGAGGSGRWGQIHAWDAIGTVCTIKPMRAVSQLVAIPDSMADDGKTLRIYGYDGTGKWIIDQDGEDGFTLTVDHTKLVPDKDTDQQVARIERITRDATSNFVKLYAFDAIQQTISVLLGYYYPDETEPQYFRIKLPLDARWIRLRYRKRTLKVTSVWQPLHLYSRMSIITMVRSLKALESDASGAQVLEEKAVKFLDDDQKARNPGEVFQLQFNEDAGWSSNFICS